MNYSGKYTFEIVHDTGWEMTVVINFDFPKIMEHIKGMVEFWIDWEDDLEDNDGDYIRTFLKRLGRKSLYLVCENNFGHLANAFNNEEGYCPMDGSHGIQIISYDPWVFETCDFTVKERLI